MKILLSVLITLFSVVYIAQQKTNVEFKKLGTVDITAHQEEWFTTLQHMEMPSPDGNSDKSKLLRAKKAMEERYPRSGTTSTNYLKADSIASIKSFSGFEANGYMGRVPDDNSIAISNDGILMSCINSNYFIYDTEADTLMDTGFLNDFVSQFNVTVSKYDPKMTYDPVEDRFVLIFLTGTVYQNSNIATCFSTTNNPMDPWNVYMVPGDALGTNHWTDYPAIALTQNDLFLTGNLLQNNMSWQTGFEQSIIWQFDKQSGYNGNATLSTSIWSGINDGAVKVRNIHPVKGARDLDGPNQYFVSNKNFSAESDTVYLIEITDSYASGNASLTLKRLSTPDHYFLGPSARQSIPKLLATNDSRVLGAVQEENWIQYVHNSMDTATGNAAFYHGTIMNYKSASPTLSGKIISDPVMDFGYPNIASTGIDANDMEVLIGFNFTSPVDTNGVAAVYMDNEGNYSEVTKLHTGEQPISILSDSIDRWGDYFGIQRRFNEPCEVWVGGMYGKSGANGTWVSRVRVSDTCRTPLPTDTLNPVFNGGSAFPNPAIDMVTVDFEMSETAFVSIQLFNEIGQQVGILYEDLAKEGENRITFNVNHLSKGLYILRIMSEDNILQTHKIIVEN
ncbi:MAG: hypothetical protein ACI9N1_001970 [Flavobacteriales bacterium]|jgi:hypothetical protein